MKPKSSAHYQREYRKRLRERGLVKKEIWIRPEHSALLSTVEKQLREIDLSPGQLAPGSNLTGETQMSQDSNVWTTRSLHAALAERGDFPNSGAEISLIEGVEPSIQITLLDFGDLPVFVTVFGDQIIAEAVLWAASDVTDSERFNDAVLRTHKFFPLSTISLDTLTDGQDYYQMFGALSATSRIQNIVLEIETLANNVLQAVEAYDEFLASPVES